MTSPILTVNPRSPDDRARRRTDTPGAGLHRASAATERPHHSAELSAWGALLLLVTAFLAIVAFVSLTRDGGPLGSLRPGGEPAELSRDAKYRAPHRDSELRRELLS